MTHRPCGTVLSWKSIVASDGEPAIVPWCPACDGPAPKDEVLGPVDYGTVPHLEYVDHILLTEIANGTRRPS